MELKHLQRKVLLVGVACFIILDIYLTSKITKLGIEIVWIAAFALALLVAILIFAVLAYKEFKRKEIEKEMDAEFEKGWAPVVGVVTLYKEFFDNKIPFTLMLQGGEKGLDFEINLPGFQGNSTFRVSFMPLNSFKILIDGVVYNWNLEALEVNENQAVLVWSGYSSQRELPEFIKASNQKLFIETKEDGFGLHFAVIEM